MKNIGETVILMLLTLLLCCLGWFVIHEGVEMAEFIRRIVVTSK